jgi:hypothetical protein
MSDPCCCRGNSKYHYYGIRVIPGSALNQLSEDGSSTVRQQSSSQKRYKFLSGSGGNGSGTQKIENQYEQNTNHSASSNHSNSSPQVLDQVQFFPVL